MGAQAKVSIRAATGGDALGLVACLRAAFEPYRSRYTPEGFADTVLTPETVHDRLATMSVLVAVSDAGAIVGTIATRAMGEEGHLRGMAVDPGWQGRGMADQLLAAAEAELRQKGCARVTLDTTEPLQRAIRFYEKNGYRPSGRVGDFFGMPLFEYVKALRPALALGHDSR